MKHIAHLLANQNKFANKIVPEVTVPLEYGVLDKLDLVSQEPETLIENTKESREATQAILSALSANPISHSPLEFQQEA